MYVEYQEEAGFFHARLVLMKSTEDMMKQVTGAECTDPEAIYWVLTPDGDIYPEEISTPPLAGLVQCLDDSTIDLTTMKPRGRRLHQGYGFVELRGVGVLTPLTVGRAMRAAWDEEKAPVRRAAPRFPPGVNFGDSQLPPGEEWVCRGPPGCEMLGKTVDALGTWTRLHDTLLTVDGTTTIVCRPKRLETEEIEEKEVDVDARVLSVQRTAGGERRRNFKDAVEELVESEWEGWPMHGPRTFQWCCRFIVEYALHTLAHHTRFAQLAQLTPNDPGAQAHELAMREMEYAITFDQLQGSEIAALEMIARRAQLIELRHRDKVIGNNLGVTVDDDTHIYLGTGRTRGLLMVSPLLEEYVSEELSRETSAAKERRKLREERAQSKPPAKK